MKIYNFLRKLKSDSKHQFKGGLNLPAHKRMSTQHLATMLPLCDHYLLSLRQRDDQWLIPLVSKGEYVLGGQKIAQPSTAMGAYLHAPTSGYIASISSEYDVMNQDALVIKLTADGKDTFLPALETLHLNTDADTLKQRIIDCGIVGLGGAGFPSHQKLTTATTLIANAAECEPYITCDDMQIRQETSALISGMEICAAIVGATKIIIVIEDDKPQAIDTLRHFLADYQSNIPIDLCIIETKYPSGNSRQLIELTLGMRIPENSHAIDYGVVCHNTATIKAIHDAVIEGQPLIQRYVTITGESLASPQVRIVRIGTPIKHILSATNNSVTQDQYLIGGPMMGKMQSSLNIGLEKTSNCLLFLPQPSPLPESPCIRCGLCSDACPMELLPQQLFWYGKNQNHKALQQYRLNDCIECNICSRVCPSHIPLVERFRESKQHLNTSLEQKELAETAKLRYEYRNERLLKEEQERKLKMANKRAELRNKVAAQNKNSQSTSATQAVSDSNKPKMQETPLSSQPIKYGEAGIVENNNDISSEAQETSNPQGAINTNFDPTQVAPSDDIKKKAIEAAKKRAAERRRAVQSKSTNKQASQPVKIHNAHKDTHE